MAAEDSGMRGRTEARSWRWSWMRVCWWSGGAAGGSATCGGRATWRQRGPATTTPSRRDRGRRVRACPCDGFSVARTFRRCVRERARARPTDERAARCRRDAAIRMANRFDLRRRPERRDLLRERDEPAARRARSRARTIACDAWRGARGRSGTSDWCHDACPPDPTPSPTPRRRPSRRNDDRSADAVQTPSGHRRRQAASSGRAACAAAGPDPPGSGYSPYGCPSFHHCLVMSFVPAGNADCDALDDPPNRQCVYHAARGGRGDLRQRTGDDDAVAAMVADARAACPCDGFSGRMTYRRCVRERVKTALLAGTLPSRCRATVTRVRESLDLRRRAERRDLLRERVERIARRARSRARTIACRAWRGGKGQVGHERLVPRRLPAGADAEPPTPTPTATADAVRVIEPGAWAALRRAAADRCRRRGRSIPTRPYGCPSFHWCVVMSLRADRERRVRCAQRRRRTGECTYAPSADPGDPNGPVVDACTFARRARAGSVRAGRACARGRSPRAPRRARPGRPGATPGRRRSTAATAAG